MYCNISIFFSKEIKRTHVHKAQDGADALSPPALKHEAVGSEAVDETLTTSMFFLESRDGEGESWRDLQGFSGWTTFHPCSVTSYPALPISSHAVHFHITNRVDAAKYHLISITFHYASGSVHTKRYCIASHLTDCTSKAVVNVEIGRDLTA